jgi:hypothetical protein
MALKLAVDITESNEGYLRKYAAESLSHLVGQWNPALRVELSSPTTVMNGPVHTFGNLAQHLTLGNPQPSVPPA